MWKIGPECAAQQAKKVRPSTMNCRERKACAGEVIAPAASPGAAESVVSSAAPAPELWLPLGLDPAARPINSHYLTAVGLLKGGVSIDAASADLARLTARFPEVLAEAYSPAFMRDYHFAAKLTQLREAVVGESARTLWMLLGAVALVLVIACANVANLFLVRIETKRREMAVRTALGADRVHLAWHYLTESTLLALVAGTLAVALAWGAIHILVAMAPTSIPRLAVGCARPARSSSRRSRWWRARGPSPRRSA